jgi:hypothetical protein
MPPKVPAISKGKAPERQPTVSPTPEDEAGPANQLLLAETETQTPQYMDDGFSRQQLDTIQLIINSLITRSLQANLILIIQSVLEEVINR